MTDGSSEKQTARELVASASRIVGFTGAGISTESGVPDFRSPEGVWACNRTVYFQEFLSSEADRIEYWRQKLEGWPAMRDARPNAGHHTFVALHAQGKLQAMITQNIERLHQRSGLPADLVLELHGTTTEAVCLTCGDRIPSDEACQRVAGGELAPRCPACGGLLKPATVSFGQVVRPVRAPAGHPRLRQSGVRSGESACASRIPNTLADSRIGHRCVAPDVCPTRSRG